MKQGLSQQTGLRQELRINPRLYQAMDMLYMPMMDLQQHLEQELLVNPFLELVEPEEEEQPAEATTTEQEKEKGEKEDEIDWEEILLNDASTWAVSSSSSNLRSTSSPSASKPPTWWTTSGSSSASSSSRPASPCCARKCSDTWTRDDVSLPVNENLVVEFCSR